MELEPEGFTSQGSSCIRAELLDLAWGKRVDSDGSASIFRLVYHSVLASQNEDSLKEQKRLCCFQRNDFVGLEYV
jgi:hypothetical protein